MQGGRGTGIGDEIKTAVELKEIYRVASRLAWLLRRGSIRRGGQQWFGLSGPGMEEALFEPPVPRRLAGMDLGEAAAPDETTILRIRHMIFQHGRTQT